MAKATAEQDFMPMRWCARAARVAAWPDGSGPAQRPTARTVIRQWDGSPRGSPRGFTATTAGGSPLTRWPGWRS